MTTPFKCSYPHSWLRQRIWWALLILVMMAASGELGVRGFRRALSDMQDFAVIYSSTRAFETGKNPYNDAAMLEAWLEANKGRTSGPVPHDLALYLATTYLLLSPLALLDWNHVRWAWLLINLIGVAVLVVTLTRYWPENLVPWQAACVAAFILGFGPIHTAIAKGQLAVVVTAILALAFVAETRHAFVPAAILLGLAASLKPQIAAPIIVLYLVQRHWKAMAIVAGVISLLLCMAALRLSWAGLSWAHWAGSWVGNMDLAARPGGVYDPSPTNPLVFQLLNLSPLLRRLTGNQAAITLLLAAVGILVCFFLWKRGQVDSTAYATACVLGLVLIAHRYYDATVLVFVFVWALRVWRRGAARVAIAGCLLMAFPVPALLIGLGHARAPAEISQSIWDAVVIQQQGLLVLIVLVAVTTVLISSPKARCVRL